MAKKKTIKQKHPKLLKKKIDFILEILNKKRAVILSDIPGLMTEGLSQHNDGSSSSPLHFADIGTDEFNQGIALSRLERDESLIDKIEIAYEKINSGKFGFCDECEKPMKLGRLEFVPWAPLCIECQELIEGNS
ncbi:MAG: hypothetical protein COA79_05380 [Planctomycetota bacterium]|nr:MAG: hypothetical protein COA79_05380 [Planctomycetota bacterium]